MEKQSTSQLTRNQIVALRGLQISQSLLRMLKRTGIYCRPAVSIEHQHLAKRYLLRGIESGGGVAGLGMYCSFTDAEGNSLPWLDRINTVGVNGLHAVVLAPSLVRIQAFRYGQMCDLLITRHQLEAPTQGVRPSLDNRILFHGRQGALAAESDNNSNQLGGALTTIFCDRSGRHLAIPNQFQMAACQVMNAASCPGCKHSHLLIPPMDDERSRSTGVRNG